MSSDDHIGELLKLAGRREMPDTEQMSRAKAAARAEWMHVTAHRRRPFAGLAIGGGALAAIALVAVMWLHTREAPARVASSPARVATLQTVLGTVVVTRNGSPPQTVNQPGLELLAGDRIETPAGSLAAFAIGGTPVNIDRGSRVVLDGRSGLTLDRGALFVDAGPAARDGDVHVRTPLGIVRHLGTQFEVRLLDEALRVRVREGSVALENADGRWVSREGEALRVTRGRSPERQPILTYGAEWSWVHELAPPFVLEGSTLGSFLEWASHHHGLRWQYADRGLRDRTAAIVLHGSIEGLPAEEALAAVLRTCGLTMRRQGELLLITKP
jgi:ferric-dicitrate binding protein FerR (iron transport regulator)